MVISRHTKAPPARTATASSHHDGSEESPRRKINKLTRATLNSVIPGRSDSRIAASRLPPAEAPSLGAHAPTPAAASTASGMLTAMIACHPNTVSSRPPKTGSMAAPAVLAICRRPNRCDGGTPDRCESGWMSVIALGNAVAEDRANAALPAHTNAKDGAHIVAAHTTAVAAIPATNTRRGPNRSPRRPINGCPVAEAR